MPALPGLPDGPALRAALARAARAAVAEEPEAEPLGRFIELGDVGGQAGYVVAVACGRVMDAAEQAALLERGLTGAQRYMLSLWSDEVEAQWVAPAPPPVSRSARAAGFNPQHEHLLGAVLVMPGGA